MFSLGQIMLLSGFVLIIGLVFFRPFMISIGRKLYGDFSKEELKKFILLAVIFGFTIGVYWLLRPLKDGVFCKLAGSSNIPIAKLVSLVVLFPIILIYSNLVDRFPRQKIFYVLCAIYGVLALIFGYLLYSPIFGETNLIKVTLATGKLETRQALMFGRILGWAWYVFIESFGSLMAALFWAFAADTTTPESAKKGYPVIMMGAQLGGIFGPWIIAANAQKFGAAPMAFVASLGIFLIAAMIKFFVFVVPQDQLVGYQTKKEGKKEEKPGFLDGLKLLVSQPYLLAIFAAISLYEIIVTIFDFQLKSMADSAVEGTGGLASYLGEYGVWTNGIAFVCLVLGINNIGRKLGLTSALVLLPILIAGAVVALFISPTLEVAFWIMVFSKSINYALYQTSKEQLYIPTSKETKYKAKAWTEMFGSRSSKAGGSLINLLQKFFTQNMFIALTTFISFGLIGVWVLCALYLGRTHKKAVSNNEVVC